MSRPVAGVSGSTGSFRFVDLFAGLGGFHVALQRLGGCGVFAAEWDPILNALYNDNFGVQPWGDVNTLIDVTRQVPDHDVLAAGFPCQPFSKAGDQQGFQHTRQGRLFFKVCEVLDEKRPGWFILENVPNIVRHDNGKTVEQMQGLLQGLGYEVQVGRFSPHDFGVPQIRDRVYFVGSRAGLAQFQWPKKDSRPTHVRDVLDVDVTPCRAVPEQTLRAIDIWDDFLQVCPRSVKLPSFPIWAMEFGATYPYTDATPVSLQHEFGVEALNMFRGSFGVSLHDYSVEGQRERLPSHARRPGHCFPGWKVKFIGQNRVFYHANKRWIDPWLKRSRVWELPSSLQKFEWNVQGGKRSIRHYVLQIRASGVRVKRLNAAPSLVAMTHTQVPILGHERRYMTVEECARLQSLGSIKLPASDLKAYKALGNAVNAKVVEHIARALLAPFCSGVGTGAGGVVRRVVEVSS